MGNSRGGAGQQLQQLAAQSRQGLEMRGLGGGQQFVDPLINGFGLGGGNALGLGQQGMPTQQPAPWAPTPANNAPIPAPIALRPIELPPFPFLNWGR